MNLSELLRGSAWRVCFLLACLAACPASLAASIGNVRFEQLNIDGGLPQLSVTAIVQDRKGFMWMGSQAGLSRYDGYRVVVFKNDPADPNSLADNSVNALHEDRQGQLWVGTRNGLQRFNRSNETFTRYLSHNSTNLAGDYFDVRAIASDRQGVLWLTTRTGLVRFDPASGQASVMRHDGANSGSLCNDDVNVFALDQHDSLWIGTLAGLDRLMPGAKRFEHFRVDEQSAADPKHNAVQALWVDRAQTLWIGTQFGLEAWQIGNGAPGKKRRFGAAEGLKPGPITALYEDRDGTMWVGTATDGLKRWDAAAGKLLTYRHQFGNPNSLADDKIASLYQDRTGMLWVGTYFGGASLLDLTSGRFSNAMADTPEQPLNISSNKISGIFGDGKDRLWVSTNGGGLNHIELESGAVTVYRHDPKDPHSLSDDQTTSIGRDKEGQLWVGTRTGLNRFEPASGRFTARLFRTEDVLSDYIQALVPDRSGILWIASRGGLHRFDPATNTVQTFRHDPADSSSIADNWVWNILEDRQGRLWVGTSNGLDLLDRSTGRFSHARHEPTQPDSLSHNRVTYLLEDHAGVLWVGTSAGLNRLKMDGAKAPTFQLYAHKDGLADPAIDGMLEDQAHHLWLSTDGGISDFNPATGKFRNYSVRDGMAKGDYLIGAAYRSSDGTMYFGAFNGGLTSFRPEAVHGNLQPPQVAITDFQIFNQSVRGGVQAAGAVLDAPIQDATQATLSYRDAMFSLEFAALHFADPKSNRFAYQLQGFDKDWVSTDASKRFATYTNLDPGRYLFRVKAANKDGVWNEQGASLAIVILPPFWKTWWFRCIVAALLLGSAFGAYRTRIRNLVSQKKMLEHQVTMRTAEVVHQKELVEQKNGELQSAYQTLEEASMTDPLTGLKNRRFLHQHLADDIALCLRRYGQWLKHRSEAPPDAADLIFFMIDLDHFKQVNDTYGHAAGDMVLVQIRERLQAVSRESDYLIRWGGEEFLMVARGANRDNAQAIAERIRRVISGCDFEVADGVRITKTCSVGFACFPYLPTHPGLLSWSQVVELADQGLYMAKHGGRNAWVGLVGAEHTALEGLFQRLMQDPKQAVQDQLVRLVSSASHIEN